MRCGFWPAGQWVHPRRVWSGAQEGAWILNEGLLYMLARSLCSHRDSPTSTRSAIPSRLRADANSRRRWWAATPPCSMG